MNTLENTYNYNDLASLNQITQKGREDEKGALKEVSRQYESMFVRMMLKSMRDANAVFEEGNPLNSNESKFYRDMFDDQLALSLSKGQGMGLADSIFRQLSAQLASDEDKKDNRIINLGDINNPKETSNLRPDPIPFIKPNQNEVKLLNEFKNSSDATNFKSLSNETVIEEKVKEPVDIITSESNPIEKKSAFNSPEEFVEKLWPVAKEFAAKQGINPQAVIAQAALETGWGKHIIHKSNGESSHNLFGIKADSRWKGSVAKVDTLEFRDGIAQKERASFRVYDSYEDSLKDYLKFIHGNARYSDAVSGGQDIDHYTKELQNAGYATDPKYAQKIQRIAKGQLLNSAINQVKRG